MHRSATPHKPTLRDAREAESQGVSPRDTSPGAFVASRVVAMSRRVAFDALIHAVLKADAVDSHARVDACSSSRGDLAISVGDEVSVFTSTDDWHMPRGACSGIATQFSAEGDASALLVRSREDSRTLSIHDRSGATVCEVPSVASTTSDFAFVVACSATESARRAFDVIRLSRSCQIVVSTHVEGESAAVQTPQSFAIAELSCVQGAHWIEKRRTLVVFGKRRRGGSAIALYTYYEGDDVQCVAVHDVGRDLTPAKKSLFRTASNELVNLAVATAGSDDTICVAVTTLDGRLSCFTLTAEVSIVDSRIDFAQHVKCAAWWDATAIAVATDDGALTVIDLSSGLNVLGDSPEFFDSIEAMCSLPRATNLGRIVLIERTSEGERRIISINERTPTEMVDLHMESQEWGLALALARQHGLETDRIYQTRWLSGPVTIEGIADSLSKINDRGWVAVQCFASVATSYEVQRHVLVYGLKETDSNARKAVGPENDEFSRRWTWWSKMRLALLGALDRADALRDNFSPDAYRKILRSTMDEAVLDAAYAGEIRVLEMLCQRFPSAVQSNILQALDALPETTRVSTYEHILPWSEAYVGSTGSSQRMERSSDWVESLEFFNELRQAKPEDSVTFANSSGVSPRASELLDSLTSREWLMSATQTMKRMNMTSESLETSTDEMETWAIERACDMDAQSGSIDNASELLQSAARCLGTDRLQECAAVSSALASAVLIAFDTDAECASEPNMLRAFVHGSLPTRFEALMRMTNEKNLARMMAGPVKDVLTIGDSSAAGSASETVQSWILTAAEAREWSHIFRIVDWIASSDVLLLDLIGGVETLASVIVESTFSQASSDSASTEELARMMDALPVAVASVPVARKAIHRMDAFRTLFATRPNLTLGDVIAAETDEDRARDLMNEYIRYRVEGVEDGNLIDWADLWSQLDRLQRNTFCHVLPREFLLGEFVRMQLRKKMWTRAKHHLPRNGNERNAVSALVGGLKELGGGASKVILNPARSEEIVLAVAHDFLKESTGVTDTFAQAAEQCLRLMPTSLGARQKLDLLEGLHVLGSFGYAFAPRDELTSEDALNAVLSAIQSHSNCYQHPDQMQDVATKLGVHRDDEKQHASILLACGTRALDMGDVGFASSIAQRLSKRNCEASWKLCAGVARFSVANDSYGANTRALLSFAIAHADDTALAQLLSDWQTTETADVLRTFSAEDHPRLLGEKTLQSAIGDTPLSTLPAATKAALQLPGFSDALDAALLSDDDKSAAAAQAVTYSLGVNGVLVSDGLLVTMAQTRLRKELAQLRSSKGDDGETVPPTLQSCMAILLMVSDSAAVASLVERVASESQEDQTMVQIIMNFGTTVHALRALRQSGRSVDASDRLKIPKLLEMVGEINDAHGIADVDYISKFRANVGSIVDAEWLAQMIPEVDPVAFAADGLDYRRKAILALAAGTTARLSSAEARDNALRLADMYGVDSFDVYLAHATVLSSEEVTGLRDVVVTLKDALPAQAGRSIEHLQTSVWPSIPSRGAASLAALCAYFDVYVACESGNVDALSRITTALRDIHSFSQTFDLKAFATCDGKPRDGGLHAALEEIRRSSEPERFEEFPEVEAESLARAVNAFLSQEECVTRAQIAFSMAMKLLTPSSGSARRTPEDRWRSIKTSYARAFSKEHLCDLVHAFSRDRTQTSRIKELDSFVAEMSLNGRLVAMTDVAGLLESSDSDSKCDVDVDGVIARMQLLARVSDEIVTLDHELLQLLDDRLREKTRILDIAVEWIGLSAPYDHVARLARIAREIGSDVEASNAVMVAVDRILSDASQSNTGKLSRVLNDTLGGHSTETSLDACRTAVFTRLEEHVGSLSKRDQHVFLDLLTKLTSVEDSPWQGWTAVATQSQSLTNILCMRIGARLAPYDDIMEPPEDSDVKDAQSRRAYFERLLNRARTTIPFRTLAEVFDLLCASEKGTWNVMKPCWLALLSTGMENDDDALDVLATQLLSPSQSFASRMQGDRRLSEDDVLQVFEHASKLHSSSLLPMAKLALLLRQQEVIEEVADALEWDAEAIAYGLHSGIIVDLYVKSPAIRERVICCAMNDERGRSILLPHLIASLTKLNMFSLAAELSLKLTSMHPSLVDFDTSIAILRKQLFLKGSSASVLLSSNMAACSDAATSEGLKLAIARLGDENLKSLNATASGMLEIALS